MRNKMNLGWMVFVYVKLILFICFVILYCIPRQRNIYLQQQFRKVGGVEKNVMDLKTYVELMEHNSTIFDSKSTKKQSYDDKLCFRLSWSNPPNVETDAIFNRYTIEDPSTNSSDRNKVCNRFITIRKIKGLMGNQMFEIAAVIGIAYSLDIIPIIPYNLILDKFFHLPNRYGISFDRLTNVVDCNCRRSGTFFNCSKYLKSTENVTVNGYMQSWKYFIDAEHLIRRLFTFESNLIINAKRFLKNVTTYGNQHVCIHVRRGDFVPIIKNGFTVADVSYINRAKLFFINKYEKVDFVLVTNDKKWCKENIKNVPISPFVNRGPDMALMVVCDHVIVTSGSFGWWGAWLSGGDTVYFKGFPSLRLSREFRKTDYYPSSWTGL